MAFHVPERYRVREGDLGSEPSDGPQGAFLFDSPEPSWKLFTIAHDGCVAPVEARFMGVSPGLLGWEHVSVQAVVRNRFVVKRSRVPSWREMCFVKAMFWDDEDVVMQLHSRRSEYVNAHPNVLHLWRPVGLAIPTPPRDLVG